MTVIWKFRLRQLIYRPISICIMSFYSSSSTSSTPRLRRTKRFTRGVFRSDHWMYASTFVLRPISFLNYSWYFVTNPPKVITYWLQLPYTYISIRSDFKIRSCMPFENFVYRYTLIILSLEVKRRHTYDNLYFQMKDIITFIYSLISLLHWLVHYR